jgi:hypothetical protein
MSKAKDLTKVRSRLNFHQKSNTSLGGRSTQRSPKRPKSAIKGLHTAAAQSQAHLPLTSRNHHEVDEYQTHLDTERENPLEQVNHTFNTPDINR